MTHPVWKLLADYDQPDQSLIEKAPMLLVYMRADGTVLDADAEAFAGYRAKDIVGRAFWLEVAHPEDRWRLTDALRRTVEERAKTTVSVRFMTPGQEPRLARLYLLPADPSTPAEIEAIAFDVTEQTDIETGLLQSDAFYRAFLEQSPMGILHLDAAGIVTFENHAFRQIVGEGVEDAWIGRRLADMPGLEAGLKPLIERMLDDGTPLHGAAATYQRAEADRPAHLVVHGSPIRQPGGAIVGGVMMIEDVTEQRRRDDELRLRDHYEKAEVVLREAVLADLNDIVFLHEAAAILGQTTRADRIHLLIHLGDEGHCATRAAWTRDEQAEPFSLYVDSGLYPALRAAVERSGSLYLRAGEVPEDATGLFELTEADEVVWVPFFDTGRLGGFVLFEHITDPAEAPADGWSPSEQRLIERLARH
ncbi:MAG: PAS domain-containing protein, partial [Rhodothermales bacterium]